MAAITDHLATLATGRVLTALEAEDLFEIILTGGADQAQIGAALAMVQVRRVNRAELLGAARVMRKHALQVPTDGLQGVVLDTCGTGGTTKVFNISTVAAIVVAAAGDGRVHVAKHGNKSRTGRGSAEVLARLGVNIHASPEVQGRCLRECNVCFSFAVAHHPAAKHAAGARKSLGFPTLFNLLGPLCNPARASHQLIGVFDPQFLEDMTITLRELGSVGAVVLHGSADGRSPDQGGGIDECSTIGPTLAYRLEKGTVAPLTFDAAREGVATSTLDRLVASDVEESAWIARSILAGTSGPHADIVALNAGLALHIVGVASSHAEGVSQAYRAMADETARRTLETLARVSNE